MLQRQFKNLPCIYYLCNIQHKDVKANTSWERFQDNFDGWSDMSTYELLCQWSSTVKQSVEYVGLVGSIYIISFHQDIT